jgi:hypothetical protein
MCNAEQFPPSPPYFYQMREENGGQAARRIRSERAEARIAKLLAERRFRPGARA